MTSYVLDASVAAKWYLPASDEDFRAESRDVLEQFVGGRIQLRVPDLFWPEVGNVLWKAVRIGFLDADSGEGALLSLSDLGIPTVAPAT